MVECKMQPEAVAWYIFASIILLAFFNIEAKTYYFHVNKTNNEYVIYNRKLNETNRSYPSGLHMSELRNNVTRKTVTEIKNHTHPLLDADWNYNWTNITRNKLPPYIYKYYEAVSKHMTGPIRILFNTMQENSSLIRFNLSQISTNDSISDVELHFYYPAEENLLEKSLILRLYQVDETYSNKSSLEHPDTHKLLNVIYILQADNGWQVFKITNAIYSSLRERQTVLVLITASAPNKDQFSIFKDKNIGAFRTFMTIEFETEKKYSFSVDNGNRADSCRRHDLYIDFEKLNWMKFIISPKGYHAFSCFGRCSRLDNLTNHIKIASFVPEIGRKPLCCVPTKYNPLPVMFYDKNGNIVIKMYEDVAVSNCGCR